MRHAAPVRLFESICMSPAYHNASASGGAPGQPLRQRLAFQVLHHHKGDAFLLSDTEKRAIEGWFRLAIARASTSNRDCRSSRRDRWANRILMATDLPETRVAGPVDLAKTTRTDECDDLIGTEFVACG